MAESRQDEGEETPRVVAGRWLAVALVLVLLGLGVYLIDGLERAREADDCLERGDRRCRTIETRPQRG